MQVIEFQNTDKERRVREYKSDKTLEAFRQRMFDIHCYAQPRILICVNNPQASIFDIDPMSKARIEWWEEKMKEYIKTNYSDIIDIEQI